MESYSARRAWVRASCYFAVCIGIAWLSGTLEQLVSARVVTDAQLDDVRWWMSFVVVSAYVRFAYFYYWPKGTVTHGRVLRPGYALLFGFLWGACQGLLFLSLYRYVQSFGTGIIANIAIMFVAYSVFSGLWQSLYWDKYVSPPHNIEEWNLRKVLVCHTPFLLLALTHLAIYDNGAIFVLWQAVAMMASACKMHFPAPGD